MDFLLFSIPPLIAVVVVAWFVIQTEVIRRATRRTTTTTWGVLIIALVLALVIAILRPGRSALLSGGGVVALTMMFAVGERIFIRLPKSEFRVRVGAPFPSFVATRMDGTPFTRDDLLAVVPAYIVFYRGHW